MSSTFTQAHLAAIEEAIAGGYLTVRYDGPTGQNTVTYQSTGELMRARSLILSKLQADSRPAIAMVQVSTARDYE